MDSPNGYMLSGGYAAGTIRILEMRAGAWVEIDTMDGELGGCDYGEYDR